MKAYLYSMKQLLPTSPAFKSPWLTGDCEWTPKNDPQGRGEYGIESKQTAFKFNKY